MLQLMDNYAATYSTLIIGLCECVAISWVYGMPILKLLQIMSYKKIMYEYKAKNSKVPTAHATQT